MNSTPEQITEIVAGATPVQIITLVFIGIIAMGFIFSTVRWVLDIKIGSLPKDIQDIRNQLEELKVNITKIEGKLWDRETIQMEITNAIREHERECPCFSKHSGR